MKSWSATVRCMPGNCYCIAMAIRARTGEVEAAYAGATGKKIKVRRVLEMPFEIYVDVSSDDEISTSDVSAAVAAVVAAAGCDGNWRVEGK
jgi:hypothetical protein